MQACLAPNSDNNPIKEWGSSAGLKINTLAFSPGGPPDKGKESITPSYSPWPSLRLFYCWVP